MEHNSRYLVTINIDTALSPRIRSISDRPSSILFTSVYFLISRWHVLNPKRYELLRRIYIYMRVYTVSGRHSEDLKLNRPLTGAGSYEGWGGGIEGNVAVSKAAAPTRCSNLLLSLPVNTYVSRCVCVRGSCVPVYAYV